jgi:hypothetical protein
MKQLLCLGVLGILLVGCGPPVQPPPPLPMPTTPEGKAAARQCLAIQNDCKRRCHFATEQLLMYRCLTKCEKDLWTCI